MESGGEVIVALQGLVRASGKGVKCKPRENRATRAEGARHALGDDRLQKRAQGFAVPDSFTHGTSAQRMAWFKKGLESQDLRGCDTFAARDL